MLWYTSRREILRVVVVAVAAFVTVCLVGTPPGGAAPRTQGARARAVGQHVIVTPHVGQVVRSDLVRIVVRSGDLSGQLTASLNGAGIGSAFGPSQRGLRTLVASVSSGVRRGTNMLRISVRRIGKPRLTGTVRFKVVDAGPLVGAGLPQRVVVGQPTKLVGEVAQPKGVQSRPVVRWSIVPLALLRPPGDTRPLAALASPGGTSTVFTASAPGQYRLRLAVGSGKSAVSDTVNVDAVHSNPLVDVNTMVHSTSGQPGIKVGGTVYPAPAVAGQWKGIVQVLVLERNTLGLVSNSTYTDTDQLASALQSLDDSDLVIVSLQKPVGAGTQPLTGSQTVIDALARIGAPYDPYTHVSGGQLSAIGVPGLAPGDANFNDDPRGAAMQGYLTPDQYLEYHFISPERISFSFPKLPSGCPEKDCDSGFEVSDIDPYTGDVRPYGKVFYDTNPQEGSEAQRTELASQQADLLADDLNTIPSGEVVRIQTVSHQPNPGGPYLPPLRAIDGTSMDRLAKAITWVGGTRNGFNLAAPAAGPATGEPVYSLVGWASAGEGNGAEAAINVDGAGSRPYLNGVLRRNNNYEFRPVGVATAGLVPSALQDLVLKAPGSEPWPLSNDPGAMKALAWLAGTDGDGHLGPDPRSDYWTSTIGDAEWGSIQGNVRAQAYPGDGNGFTLDQFNAAQKELVKEIGWVVNVHTYMNDLSSPFNGDTALKSWADTKRIAADVYKAANQPHDQTGLRWTQFTSIILKVLGPLTGGASGVVASMLDFGVWAAGAGPNGGPSGIDISFAADELGDKFVNQAQQAQATYASIGNIIVSDYAKLSVVGPSGGCDPSAPTCDKALSFTNEDRVAAVATIDRGVERLAYEKLFPLGFWVMHLNETPDYRATKSNPPNPDYYRCGIGYYPFYAATPIDWTWFLQSLDPLDHSNNKYRVFVWAAPPAETDEHATLALDSMLHRMFDPISQSNDPEDGGLGIPKTLLARIAPTHTWYDEAVGFDSCWWSNYE